jgi:hypothetical protein
MNAERCRDGNLPFEPSMRRADGVLAIAIIERASINCTETKIAMAILRDDFSPHGVPPKDRRLKPSSKPRLNCFRATCHKWPCVHRNGRNVLYKYRLCKGQFWQNEVKIVNLFNMGWGGRQRRKRKPPRMPCSDGLAAVFLEFLFGSARALDAVMGLL